MPWCQRRGTGRSGNLDVAHQAARSGTFLPSLVLFLTTTIMLLLKNNKNYTTSTKNTHLYHLRKLKFRLLGTEPLAVMTTDRVRLFPLRLLGSSELLPDPSTCELIPLLPWMLSFQKRPGTKHQFCR